MVFWVALQLGPENPIEVMDEEADGEGEVVEVGMMRTWLQSLGARGQIPSGYMVSS